MNKQEKVWIQAKKLAECFIKANLKSYSLNYDDGTLEGIDIKIKKVARKP